MMAERADAGRRRTGSDRSRRRDGARDRARDRAEDAMGETRWVS